MAGTEEVDEPANSANATTNRMVFTPVLDHRSNDGGLPISTRLMPMDRMITNSQWHRHLADLGQDQGSPRFSTAFSTPTNSLLNSAILAAILLTSFPSDVPRRLLTTFVNPTFQRCLSSAVAVGVWCVPRTRRRSLSVRVSGGLVLAGRCPSR
jgi:hypothetical protein